MRPRTTTAVVQPDSPIQTSPATAPDWLLSYLKSNKALVDKELDLCLISKSPYNKKIYESMRYSLLAGGKRIRPILAIAAYQMFADDPENLAPVIPTALSVEMLHTMSLIHDDLPSMDDDDFRRGMPTNHMVFGESIAVLSGDAMLSHAFDVVARNTVGVDPARVIRVIAALTDSVGPEGVAAGQVLDLESEGEEHVSLDTLTWIHTHKTAELLRVSVVAGAMIAGASDEDVRRVSEFATKTGLAFQIADDILDVTKSTEQLGKTAGKDEASKKATYPRLLGLEGSRKRAEKLIAEGKQAIIPYGQRSTTLLALADFIINRANWSCFL